MATIEIKIDDYIEEIATDTLVAELRRRKLGIEISTGRDVAQRLRGAFYRRDASLFEALLVTHLDPIEFKGERAA